MIKLLIVTKKMFKKISDFLKIYFEMSTLVYDISTLKVLKLKKNTSIS